MEALQAAAAAAARNVDPTRTENLRFGLTADLLQDIERDGERFRQFAVSRRDKIVIESRASFGHDSVSEARRLRNIVVTLAQTNVHRTIKQAQAGVISGPHWWLMLQTIGNARGHLYTGSRVLSANWLADALALLVPAFKSEYDMTASEVQVVVEKIMAEPNYVFTEYELSLTHRTVRTGPLRSTRSDKGKRRKREGPPIHELLENEVEGGAVASDRDAGDGDAGDGEASSDEELKMTPAPPRALVPGRELHAPVQQAEVPRMGGLRLV
jgi:hypothetical protein